MAIDVTGDYPAECECEAVLVDGTIAQIRPIRPDDADDLADFHDHLSQETVRLRFFAAHPHLRAAEIERFTRVDYRDRLALIAHVHGRLAAVARYDRLPGTDRAEVAFVVADARQRLGLGTLLLEHLAAAARRRGVASFVAETLWSNRPMQEVFSRAGFACVQKWEGGVVDVSFPIGLTQAYLDAVLERDVLSIHAWLRPMVAPAPPRSRADSVDSAPGRFMVEDLTDPGMKRSRVGVVCQSPVAATAISTACRDHKIGVSAVVASRAQSDSDVSDLLAYLAADEDTDVIVVQADQVTRPCRLMTRARAAARRKPIVALLPSSSDHSGGEREFSARQLCALWEQAGVATSTSPAGVAARAVVMLNEWQSGVWKPPTTGALVDLPGCDPARARAVIDGYRSTGLDGDGSSPSPPYRIGTPDAASLLAAYGLPALAFALGPLPRGLTLTVTDDPTRGLAAYVSSSASDSSSTWFRLLPLTDRDAYELVRRAAAGCANAELLVDVVLRAARLVGDQPDLCRLELALGADFSPIRPVGSVWVGPVRAYDDDPFVRQALV